VLIVVAILAMVAGGVAFFALPRFQDATIPTAPDNQAMRFRKLETPVPPCRTRSRQRSRPTQWRAESRRKA
jgi:hypothetical protein